MKKIIKIKRGELTTQQIVGLIILITSFAVILFFFFRLNLGETTNKEICHNSVVLAGKGTLSKIATGGGSLDCRTSYVCISGGGKCEGINPTETKKINMNPKLVKDKSKDDLIKEQVMKAIADEMVDCWWMFGEGKIDYIGGTSFTGEKSCSICSMVVFDKNIENQEISYNYFYNYLRTTKKDNSKTYLNYLFGVDDVDGLGKGYLSNEFDFSKEYFISTALGKESVFESYWTIPGLSIKTIKYFTKDGKEIDSKVGALPPTILEAKKENYKKIDCNEFITKA
jgi:hypothetical protein